MQPHCTMQFTHTHNQVSPVHLGCVMQTHAVQAQVAHLCKNVVCAGTVCNQVFDHHHRCKLALAVAAVEGPRDGLQVRVVLQQQSRRR